MRQISKIHFTTEGEISNYFFSKTSKLGPRGPQRGNKHNTFISSLISMV